MATRKVKQPSVPRFIAIDTETTGTTFHSEKKAWVFAVSMCDYQGKTWLFTWKVDPFTRKVKVDKNDVAKIKTILDKYSIVVMHNARFDVRALSTIGIEWPHLEHIEDTLIASHVLDNCEDHGLKPLAKKYLDISDEDQKDLQAAIVSAHRHAKNRGWTQGDAVAHDGWMPALVNPHDKSLQKYALLDAERTAALWAAVYWPLLHSEGLWEQYLEHKRAFPVIYRMESQGISLRKHVWRREHARYGREAAARLRTAKALVPRDFNLASNKQLQERLYGDWKLPVLLRTKDGISTAAPTLHRLLEHCQPKSAPHTFITNLLEEKKYRNAGKQLESFRDIAVERNGLWYLHPSVNQTGTRTTRVSAFPQNVGKGVDLAELGFSEEEEVEFKLRKVFGPSPGRIWYSWDYDQLQLRIFAHACGEKALIKAFEDGWDAHTFVASRIYKTDKPNKLQRRVAKNVNFGFIFGAQPAKIDATAGVPGLWDTVTKLFPSAPAYMERIKAQVKKCGYVHTLGGYRLYLPLVPNKWTNRVEPKAYSGVCYIVQGTEGELVKDAMVRVDSLLSPQEKLIMQVHDELNLDFPKTPKHPLDKLRQIKGAMEAAGDKYGVAVKAKCEVVRTSWDNGKLLDV